MGSSPSRPKFKKEGTWEYFELPSPTLRLRVMKGERETLILELWGLSKNRVTKTIWVRVHPPDGHVIRQVNGKAVKNLEPEALRVARLVREGKISDSNVILAI